MKHLLIFCIFFVAIINVWVDSVSIQGTRGPTWGDTSGEHTFIQRITKQKIPFIKRETTVEYPELEAGKTISIPNLRGIEHVNLVDKAKEECGEPKVELKNGGPPHGLATIHITSDRGCPLDSVLTFYTTKNQN